MSNVFINHKKILLVIACSILVSFLTLLASSCITSFVYPLIPGAAYYNDGEMFYILGSSMAKGYKPYIDVFDHKGLYIFYYTMVAGALGRVGLFFVQLILLSVTAFFIYKAIELYTSRISIIAIAIFLFMAIYAFTGQTPNDSDLEMPFNAIMIYFYLRALKTNDNKYFLIGNIFTGISAGIALNLRVSDALLPFAFTVYYFIYSLMHKDLKGLLFNALVVVGAIAVMSIPPFIHAYAGGFLFDMVDAVYLSNFKYITTSKTGGDDFRIIAYIIVAVVIVALTLLIYFKRKELSRDFIVFILVTTLVSLAIEVVIALYPHYFIVLYPYFAIILTVLLYPYLERDGKKRKSLLPVFISSAVLLVGSYAFHAVFYSSFYKTDVSNVNFVNETISKEDKAGHTLVFATPSLYTNADIKIGYGDFSCQANHIKFSERFSRDNLVSYLDSDASRYVITEQGDNEFVSSLFNDLKVSHYEKVTSPSDVTITIYMRVVN